MDAASRTMYSAGMWCSRRPVLVCCAHAVIAAAVVASCASAAPRGATESSAREHDCGIEIVGDPPGPRYVEIARISLEGDTNFGRGRYRDTRHSANAVREMVCELGGDAMVTEMNGYGEIMRVIVFRRRAPSEADPS
jgi:hypothetical protein